MRPVSLCVRGRCARTTPPPWSPGAFRMTATRVFRGSPTIRAAKAPMKPAQRAAALNAPAMVTRLARGPHQPFLHAARQESGGGSPVANAAGFFFERREKSNWKGVVFRLRPLLPLTAVSDPFQVWSCRPCLYCLSERALSATDMLRFLL